MSELSSAIREIDGFLASWQQGDPAMKQFFVTLCDQVAAMEDISLQVVSRPGISFSLRPRHRHQRERELFAMIDVIDDNPEQRWLSVCFYGDMISDPQERGEVIPGGLAGSDGYCFDIYEAEPSALDYLGSRLQEAWLRASA